MNIEDLSKYNSACISVVAALYDWRSGNLESAAERISDLRESGMLEENNQVSMELSRIILLIEQGDHTRASNRLPILKDALEGLTASIDSDLLNMHYFH